jgi:Flp pilus assembly protein TadD
VGRRRLLIVLLVSLGVAALGLLARPVPAAGEGDVAQVYLQEALELDPKHADEHPNMGAAPVHRGRFAEARRHLDDALRFNPSHAGARANRDAVARSLR